jgi:hypothetical protein
MNLLRKPWFRVIVSLLAGGLAQEIIHISTGDPNRPQTTNLALLYGLVVFALLTLLVKRSDKKTF